MIKRYLFIFMIFILLLSSLSATGRTESSTGKSSGNTWKLKDDLGYTVTLPKAPTTIASLSLFSDEVLFSLVDSERLLGVSRIAGDPVYSNVAHRINEVPNHLELKAETLIELQPDLILTASWSDPAVIEQLKRAGLSVFQIESPKTLEEIKAKILLLGRLTGEEKAAEDIVKVMEGNLKILEEQIEKIPESQRLTALDYSSWESSMGGGSSWNAILEAAGLINGAAAFESDQFGQVPMSRELIIEINPDIIFLPGWVYGDSEAAEDFLNQVMDDPSLRYVRAISNEEVYLMPEYLRSTCSQYIVEAAWFAAQRAYPRYFNP